MPSYPPLRNVEGEEFEQPINKNTEGLVAKGFYPQSSSSDDENVGLERDNSNNLVLKDTTGTKTLSQLPPTATATGQVLISVYGTTFEAHQPLVGYGIIVSDTGYMVVKG